MHLEKGHLGVHLEKGHLGVHLRACETRANCAVRHSVKFLWVMAGPSIDTVKDLKLCDLKKSCNTPLSDLANLS